MERRRLGGVDGLVDHLFRHRAGQMVATLTRVFGPEHLALAEEVVQDALLSAMQTWPMRGVPDNPGAWLFQVARNRALDELRRNTSLRAKEQDVVAAFTPDGQREDVAFAHEMRDDQLRMMLMCCHPAIPEEARIALTLKTVGGFSVTEIARAFLSKDETIAQRLVRAKRLIREQKIPMEMPSRAEMASRLDSVLTVLYLLFSEGYNAHDGEELIRHDLVQEAIRLMRVVADHPVASSPSADALLALMLLQASRLPARIGGAGELTTLAEQDRSRWDHALLREGMERLERSARGETITRYHLEAAIAAVHAAARDFESTDWNRLIELYDELMLLQPTPVVALNRAISIAMAHGPERGIAEIERIALPDYLPLPTTLGELFLRSGDRERAAEHFKRALEMPGTGPEKRFLLRKLAECGVGS